MSSVQQALIVQSRGHACVVPDHPSPPLRPDSVLVKPVAVALNPHDYKAIDFLDVDDCVVGCDFSGVVAAVPDGPAARQFKVGDRIMGTVHGTNSVRPLDGAFQEYLVARTGVCIPMPETMSFEDAAIPHVAIVTCALALYQMLGLPSFDNPAQDPNPILIFGGSTATGTMAIQFAKLSGLTVLTTCSPHNFDLVRSRGADHVFDYRDHNVIAEIKRLSNHDLRYVFDCIGEGPAPSFCFESMSAEGGRYVTVDKPQEPPRKNIVTMRVTGQTGYGEDCEIKGSGFFGSSDFSMFFPASQEDYEFCTEFYGKTAKLLAEGRLKMHPAEVGDGGLQGILQGLHALRTGKVSGRKLVYRI